MFKKMLEDEKRRYKLPFNSELLETLLFWVIWRTYLTLAVLFHNVKTPDLQLTKNMFSVRFLCLFLNFLGIKMPVIFHLSRNISACYYWQNDEFTRHYFYFYVVFVHL